MSDQAPQATPAQQQIAVKLDEVMLDIITNGEEVVVTEADGSQAIKRKKPCAAMLGAIERRIHHLRIQSPVVPGTAADDLVNEANRRIADGRIRFNGQDVNAPLDEDGEDAATA